MNQTNLSDESLAKVSSIIVDTFAKAFKGDLRTIQTRLFARRVTQRKRAQFRKAARVQLLRFRNRPRCHNGSSSRFENEIVHTYSDYDGTGLYFQMQSGQVLSADRIVRKSRNPFLRRLVDKEILDNASRA